MPRIKTREMVAEMARAADCTAMVGQRMKEAYLRSRERKESGNEYAADLLTDGMEDLSHDVIHGGEKLLRKQMEKSRSRQGRPANTRQTGQGSGRGNNATPAGNGIKQRSVASTFQTNTTVQSGSTAAKNAHKSAYATRQVIKSARKAQARRRAVQTTKEAARAVATAVKGAINGTRALAAAIVAGGWVAVLVVVVICLIGLIVGSSYGIFFSGEDTGSGQTMRSVVQEINDEYLATLDSIKALNLHDKLEMSGSRAVWPEVLAVYAVKTTTDPNHPQDVASITDEKKELLREIFWQMNSISFRTATVSETQYIETDDGSGNIVSEEITVTQTCLYITVSHKTAPEVAAELGFAGSQTEQLEALLADENDSLWTAVLYGITAGDGQIIEVARSQIGNVGGQPFWSWYGFSNRVAWCACFVSWCANECGYIEAGVIPKFASCANGVQWFRERGQWADNSIEPTPGMLIFFDWNSDGHSDHVGIVERCEGGVVHTIEGNTSDSCRERSYAVGHHQIQGYGIPDY